MRGRKEGGDFSWLMEQPYCRSLGGAVGLLKKPEEVQKKL